LRTLANPRKAQAGGPRRPGLARPFARLAVGATTPTRRSAKIRWSRARPVRRMRR
jgi:hypothetical protein